MKLPQMKRDGVRLSSDKKEGGQTSGKTTIRKKFD